MQKSLSRDLVTASASASKQNFSTFALQPGLLPGPSSSLWWGNDACTKSAAVCHVQPLLWIDVLPCELRCSFHAAFEASLYLSITISILKSQWQKGWGAWNLQVTSLNPNPKYLPRRMQAEAQHSPTLALLLCWWLHCYPWQGTSLKAVWVPSAWLPCHSSLLTCTWEPKHTCKCTWCSATLSSLSFVSGTRVKAKPPDCFVQHTQLLLGASGRRLIPGA